MRFHCPRHDCEYTTNVSIRMTEHIDKNGHNKRKDGRDSKFKGNNAIKGKKKDKK